MERRSFLGAHTAAFLSVLIEGSFAQAARRAERFTRWSKIARTSCQDERLSRELNNRSGAHSAGRRLMSSNIVVPLVRHGLPEMEPMSLLRTLY